MAAANGTARTILAVILFILVICIVSAYLFTFMGEALVRRPLLDRYPVSTNFHDHRVDHWTKIDLA
jgi:hypothetical protein